MALRNHCDGCERELAAEYVVVALGRDRTPTKMSVRVREEPGDVRYAEVCSVACAVRWVEAHWAAPVVGGLVG